MNTIKLSFWGHDGEADDWAPAWMFSRHRWPGDLRPGTYTDQEQADLAIHFFKRANAKQLLFSPMLEVSPKFPFYAEFPDQLDNMVNRCAWLLAHFRNQANWLRLFDRQGNARLAFWLIETIHAGPVSPTRFAAAFDQVSQRLESQYNVKVGFVLSPTPLPANGSELGPNPEELLSSASILAISPGAATAGASDPKPQNKVTEVDRLENQERFLKKWTTTRFPVIATVIPGYDSHLVFPGNGSYGFNPSWRASQIHLARRYGRDGVCIDCWNGWTEGYGIPPTSENGDVNVAWARDLIAAIADRQMPSSPNR